MTEAEFKRFAAQGYSRVPVVLETCADLDTPLSVYLKLASRPNTYLLESMIGGEPCRCSVRRDPSFRSG